MKVIKFKDLKNIIDIKKEGLTGKEVLQAAVPGYNPRSSKLWLAKLYAESQAEDEDEDDDEEDDNASSDEEQTLSEDFRMIDEMLKALQSAKVLDVRMHTRTYQSLVHYSILDVC